MRRTLIALLLPIWLLAGWSGFAHPHVAEVKGKSAKEQVVVSKYEAAPLTVLQVQAPNADLLVPMPVSVSHPAIPVHQVAAPLKALRSRPVPAFASRYFTKAIALRAP